MAESSAENLYIGVKLAPNLAFFAAAFYCLYTPAKCGSNPESLPVFAAPDFV